MYAFYPIFFFFLMIRRPPRSTLPYTTLFRSRAFARFAGAVARRYGSRVDRYLMWNEPNQPGWLRPQAECRGRRCTRSEEHTSELQSRQYLVCRLLLEKKKQNLHLISRQVMMR